MANFDVSNAKFNREIRKMEVTDPCHADTFNNVFKTLINNDVALNSQYEDCVKKIGNIKDLKTTNKDNLVSALNEVFTSADNGKKSIYNSIVGKKVTPKSKDFKDLTDAITDIKLGQGTAQPSQVLKGATFTNDTGVVQEGNIPVIPFKQISPS
ncbi:hypothetical protein Z959_08255, partial [Clostridium novyi B str. ATCC 27606]